MPKANKISTGKVHVDFAEPVDPTSVHILWQLPLGALVTSVVVSYVIMPLDVVQEKRRRHDAAVKANATRKAKKEASNG
ncbi:MAG: hypothetical protein IJP66_04325 [Kiritimatiellae bacterium]|nr:hypothetical protein [Kiritimatiellia bacterium]